MTFQDQISAAIMAAKSATYNWADKDIIRYNNGDDLMYKKHIIIVNNWILILENYMDYNFDSNGQQVSPYTCLSVDDINMIISKINAINC